MKWTRARSAVAAAAIACVAGSAAVVFPSCWAGFAPAFAQPAVPAPTTPAQDPNRDLVVARVGEKTITLGELDRRIHQTPAFALRKYGATPEEIRRNFLDKVMVRELVLTQGALDQGFDKRVEIAEHIRALLRSALVERLKKDAQAGPPSDADVRDYYEANKDKFQAPHRLSMWRILVDTEDDARAVIADMRQDHDLDVKKWSKLARDKSVDKSSAMRSGNLGFMNPDGSTGQPDLQYDVSLFEAADKAKDGELVPDPVKEGDKWAVIWRKQGMRPVSRTVETESATIKAAIIDERIRKSIDDLLSKLRGESVSEIHPELCDMITVTETGEIERAKRPGVLPKPKRVETTPVDTPAGLR